MRAVSALILLTAVALTGGCASSSPPAAATSAALPASTTAPPSATPTTTSPARPAAVTPSSAWGTGPTKATRQPSVPPLPLLTKVRYAAHQDGYDRVVLDFAGGIPGYSATYVKEVRADGSDELMSVPGEAFLQIVLNPAQAHQENGTATVTGIHRTGLAGIKAYAIAGDYEGYVTVVLGVTGVRKYHIGELSDRIYIDVAV